MNSTLPTRVSAQVFTFRSPKVLVALVVLNLGLSAFLVHTSLSASTTRLRLQSLQAESKHIAQLSDKVLLLRGQRNERPEFATIGANEMVTLLSSSSEKHGVSVTRLQQDAQSRISIAIDNVSYAHLIDWLIALRQKHGLSVQKISVLAEPSPGRVSARLSFKASSKHNEKARRQLA